MHYEKTSDLTFRRSSRNACSVILLLAEQAHGGRGQDHRDQVSSNGEVRKYCTRGDD